MKSTHFRDDHAEIVKHIAYGYVDGEGGATYRLSVTNFDTVGATSLLTTVEDLAGVYIEAAGVGASAARKTF